jgi:hypothetical protein
VRGWNHRSGSAYARLSVSSWAGVRAVTVFGLLLVVRKHRDVFQTHMTHDLPRGRKDTTMGAGGRGIHVLSTIDSSCVSKRSPSDDEVGV